MDATEAIYTYLTTAPDSQFAGHAVEVLAHWQGVDNLLWRVACQGRDAVVKLFIDAGQVRSRRQYDGQQMFYPAGFACRPLWYDWQPQGLARPVLVYEWTDGDALTAADALTLHETARILAYVHMADAEDVGRLSPNPVNLDYFWRLLANSVTKIEEWLVQAGAEELGVGFAALAAEATLLAEQALPLVMQAAPSAIHGDPKLENFVQAGGSVTLLDWERFGLGDPALEAATFLHMGQATLNEEAQTAWLETYLGYADLPDLGFRVDIYRRLLPFQSACFLLDGLRELAADSDALDQYRDDLPFLRATLVASLNQAATTLSVTRQGYEESTIHLIDSLQTERTTRSLDSGAT